MSTNSRFIRVALHLPVISNETVRVQAVIGGFKSAEALQHALLANSWPCKVKHVETATLLILSDFRTYGLSSCDDFVTLTPTEPLVARDVDDAMFELGLALSSAVSQRAERAVYNIRIAQKAKLG